MVGWGGDYRAIYILSKILQNLRNSEISSKNPLLFGKMNGFKSLLAGRREFGFFWGSGGVRGGSSVKGPLILPPDARITL